jgi:hypothetical protein
MKGEIREEALLPLFEDEPVAASKYFGFGAAQKHRLVLL